MHAERKVRAAFNRDIGNKVLFIKDGKLLFIKGIKLKTIADRKAYFASLRARQAQPIVILAELPPEQAFDLWKQHVLGDQRSEGRRVGKECVSTCSSRVSAYLSTKHIQYHSTDSQIIKSH